MRGTGTVIAPAAPDFLQEGDPLRQAGDGRGCFAWVKHDIKVETEAVWRGENPEAAIQDPGTLPYRLAYRSFGSPPLTGAACQISNLTDCNSRAQKKEGFPLFTIFF